MALKGLAKAFLKPAPKDIKNLWTGLAPTAFVSAAVFGGTLMATGTKGTIDYYNKRRLGSVQYMGNIPETYYDATPQADRVTGDKTLGATGDLVFGLHAAANR